jgi:hypothetical protein
MRLTACKIMLKAWLGIHKEVSMPKVFVTFREGLAQDFVARAHWTLRSKFSQLADDETHEFDWSVGIEEAEPNSSMLTVSLPDKVTKLDCFGILTDSFGEISFVSDDITILVSRFKTPEGYNLRIQSDPEIRGYQVHVSPVGGEMAL